MKLQAELEHAREQARIQEQHGQMDTCWHEQVRNLESALKELTKDKEPK